MNDIKILTKLSENDYSLIKKLTKTTSNFLLKICEYIIKNNLNNLDKAYLVVNILNIGVYVNKVSKPKELVTCTTLNSLRWVNNSCYLDSVLISLFLIPNKFIDNHILSNLYPKKINFCSNISSVITTIEELQKRGNIQDELRNTTNFLRTSGNININCTKVRKLLRECNNNYYSDWWSSNQQDTSEFLLYIINMFVDDITIINKTVTYTDIHDNIIKIESIKEKIGIVCNIQNSEIIQYKKLSGYTTYKDITQLKYKGSLINRTEINTIVYTPYIIFNLNRKNINEHGVSVITNIEIIPDENIQIGEDFFLLHSIIVYINHHYTCYFLCNYKWYYYKDLVKGYRIIGNGLYKNLIKDTNIKTTGILFFYKKVEWVVYSIEGCTYCNNTKDLLDNNNQDYIIKKINNEDKDSLYRKIDIKTKEHRTFPIIFRNGIFLGGYINIKNVFK